MEREPTNNLEEERLAALLRGALSAAPGEVSGAASSPNPAALAEIRVKSLQVFMETEGIETPTTLTPALSQRERETKKRNLMLTLAFRGLAAVAASAAMIAAWFNLGTPNSVSGAPFSDVLANLRTAKTLELRIARDGHSSQVLVSAPGLVRYEDSPRKYRIAAGSRLWKIDEEANTAATGDSPWFLNPEQQIDLLGLLELGVTDASALLKAHPQGKSQYDGHECDLYRVDLPAQKGRLQFDAFADATSHQLLGITARPAGGNNAGPPLAELQLIAMNAPLDETKFIVAKSLTEDGRIGKISDAQGIVVLRPMLAKRWTPICRETLLKPGDWIRTEIRGANAIKVRFSSDVELTLGPGTLVECISPTQARIHSGELQVNVPKPDAEKGKDDKEPAKKPGEFELLAPKNGSEKLVTPGKTFFRITRDEKLAKFEKPEQFPKWLAGFEGTSANESLGSLIVNLPDGRNEPLTVGYHKVSVEIRDQIARTTIEESFVNHTKARLEGVFHFPLPQDASISGFGMWIGNELVEADIVEKQRAREIYETILREKRDPGLLEWTSGNLFKARVFPIEAESEKRVKIVYTQVLPLRANKYRYAYGLRSDLLRTKPLRELSLSVTVNSALPLKNVSCPTHTTRNQLTPHSGRVEFSAQEYSPNRDFEVVCEIDGKQSDVVAIPHRRGSDGYLLVQLSPPGIEGNWQREILPDGNPLNVVLLCDTSASMDSEKRKQQADFVTTVLSALGEKDRFMLAATDVATAWMANEPLAPTAENLAKAGEFLEKRISLGWTNLDQAFGSALRKAPASSQIIYVGDGIVSAGDRDPASFVKRLAKMLADQQAEQKANAKDPKETVSPTIHAVTVGNVSEAIVQKGIASVGGGSVRAISGEQTAQVVATELLNEIAQPGLRDLNVEFRGVKVAAMYPDRLPNVAAGTQQILVGRYLPEGKDQQGEIIVTGKRGSEPVRYVAKVSFKDAEEGNSFIPRLWARSHLDRLLAQGSNSRIHEEIIALSEEFHIITPQTSLLVLETDADRERFGVKRRYEMRDGERFFQKGQDNANYELAQQQMKRAAEWRLNLRRQVLRQLATLGRNPQIFQQQAQRLNQLAEHQWGVRSAGGGGYGGGEDFGVLLTDNFSDMGGFGGGGGGFASSGSFKLGGGTLSLSSSHSMLGRGYNRNNEFGYEIDGEKRDRSALGIDEFYSDPSGSMGGDIAEGRKESKDLFLGDLDDVEAKGRSINSRRWLDREEDLKAGLPGLRDVELEFAAVDGPRPTPDGRPMAADEPIEQKLQDRSKRSMSSWSRESLSEESVELGFAFDDNGDNSFARGTVQLQGLGFASYPGKPDSLAYFSQGRRHGYYPDYTSWLRTIYPGLSGKPPKPLADPKTWSPEAIALAKSLLRNDSLLKLEGGLEIKTINNSFDPIWNRRSSHSSDLTLYAPTAWLTKPLNIDDQTIVNYCDKKERGVFSLAFLLGQTRSSVERDLTIPPFSLTDSSLTSLVETYRGQHARVEQKEGTQARLILTYDNSKYEQHFLIDTAKHVLLKTESFDDGKLQATITYTDFVEVAGTWWAKKATTTDAKGQKTVEVLHEIKSLAKDAYDARIKTELAPLTTVQLLHHPFPKFKDAQQHVVDGTASYEERLMLILHNCQLQQWDEVLKQSDAAEKLAADKPGVRWLRTMALATMHRNEETQKRLVEEAKQLVAKQQPDELFLAMFILNQLQGVSGPNEYLPVVESLKPVAQRQPADSNALHNWRDHLVGALENAGHNAAALDLRRVLAEQLPWETSRQTEYARRLMSSDKSAEAYAWLDQQLARKIERTSSDQDSLRTAYADLYRTEFRWADLLNFTTDWVGRNPDDQTAYQQHLSALIYNDQLDAANALAEQWLKEARGEKLVHGGRLSKLYVAVSFAQGSCYNLSFQRMDERWHEPLAETAMYFVRDPARWDVTNSIMGNRLNSVDAGDRVRAFFLKLLQTESDKLNPGQLSFLIGQAMSGRLEFAEPLNGHKQLQASEVPAEIWKAIATTLRTRWEKLADKEELFDEKQMLSEALRTIYASRFADTELLPFLRARLKGAAPNYAVGYTAALFDTLLSQKWTAEIESEALHLLPQLSNAEEPSRKLVAEVPALHRFVDAMLASRIAAADRELNDKGGVDKLTRTELAAKKAEFKKNAQISFAKFLADEATAHEQTKNPLADWLRIESFWLDVQLEQHLDDVAAFCWKKLGDAPPKPDANDKDGVEADHDEDLSDPALIAIFVQKSFDSLLQNRAFVTVMNLSARKNAQPAAIDKLLKYLDAGIANGGDGAISWRHTKYQVLIALDKPDDLETHLRDWVKTDVSTAPWKKSLALLLAERGKLDEAIQLFEAAEKDKLLSAKDYLTLSAWYQVRDRRDDHERTQYEFYKHLPENQLAQMIYGTVNRSQPHNNHPLSSELDEKTLLAFRALFEKSANPQNYLFQVEQLYLECLDFRLLQVTADGMLGHSPEQIYPYLQGIRGRIIDHVRKEATADEMLARIKKLREGKRTPTDLRALDLFEAMIERQSSTVQNQRGPHVEACLAALQRAFDRQWEKGEPMLMADFLWNLQSMPDPKLVEEQLRELRELQKAAKPDSREHLLITSHLCKLYFWSYGRRDEGIQQIEAEIKSYEQAHNGKMPREDESLLNDFVSMLTDLNQFAAGEAVWQNHLKNPVNDEQRKHFEEQLWNLFNLTLDRKGEVSLGKGETLLHNLIEYGLKQIDAAGDENRRYTCVSQFINTFESAHRQHLKSAEEPLRKFVFEQFPLILKKQVSQYANTAHLPTWIVRETLGPKAVLQYIVERMEQWPQRLQISWESAWQRLANELGMYRQQAAESKSDIKDLEKRVLALVVAEIKFDMRTGENRNAYLYRKHNQYFWAEKTNDFAAAAEEVYRERRTSGRTVGYIANYLWGGLDLRARAIEMLFVAHKEGILDQTGQVTLVEYLHHENRYAESIPLLDPLVTAYPDLIYYRVLLMRAYFHAQRPQQLTELVKQTDEYFHQGGRWVEGNIREFAHACLDCKHFTESVAYYQEAISLHQRATGGRSLGDHVLSFDYKMLSQAHSALGHTKEAVDAASAAVVCWGAKHNMRTDALENLRNVLRQAKDLDAYVKSLDAETAKSGQDSPLLRKMLGEVYQEKNQLDKAVVQFQLARDLQPHDREVYQHLMACYDRLKRPAEATQQLLAQLDFDRHDLKLYEQLAERLKDDEPQAERAATSIIEAGPTEAENHQAMAQLRQKQNRWDEAINHWKEVAELRKLEPSGLIGLATAQVHQKQWTDARATLNKLQKTDWPSRFENELNAAKNLQNQLPK